jgi:hypothetical protein
MLALFICFVLGFIGGMIYSNVAEKKVEAEVKVVAKKVEGEIKEVESAIVELPKEVVKTVVNKL